ncbi:MAG: nucleotidyltransferase substrate binding protein [Bacteroidales bacterium]|nr:nucleotidyltransferase substrate binding protein [Bacteroidales bacterium]
MSTQQDIRWIQRFSNYRKALVKLKQAVEIFSRKTDFGKDVLEVLEEGLIQCFEFSHELAWKVMRDYLIYQGYTGITGSRDAIRKALEINIIDDAAWMETIKDRNLTSHTYNEETAAQIHENIVKIYFPLFCEFERKMTELAGIEPKLFNE